MKSIEYMNFILHCLLHVPYRKIYLCNSQIREIYNKKVDLFCQFLYNIIIGFIKSVIKFMGDGSYAWWGIKGDTE